jgi:hypothetical protein
MGRCRRRRTARVVRRGTARHGRRRRCRSAVDTSDVSAALPNERNVWKRRESIPLHLRQFLNVRDCQRLLRLRLRQLRELRRCGTARNLLSTKKNCTNDTKWSGVEWSGVEWMYAVACHDEWCDCTRRRFASPSRYPVAARTHATTQDNSVIHRGIGMRSYRTFSGLDLTMTGCSSSVAAVGRSDGSFAKHFTSKSFSSCTPQRSVALSTEKIIHWKFGACGNRTGVMSAGSGGSGSVTILKSAVIGWHR